MMEHREKGCSCALHDSGVSQSLQVNGGLSELPFELNFLFQELEFERGLWQAASDGDTERVKRLLGSGHSANGKDSSAYTALVY